MSDNKKMQNDDLAQTNYLRQDRREFLVAAKKWSKAVVAGALLGSVAVLPGCCCRPTGWRNGGVSWGNRGRGWGNRGTVWRNGGGSWANRN